MICRLCIGPQHIIDQSAFLNSKSLSLIGATAEPTLYKSSAPHKTIICFLSSGTFGESLIIPEIIPNKVKYYNV